MHNPEEPLSFLLPPPFDARSGRRRRHMNSPGTSPHDLQSHLYQSFLDGKTTDVSLRITGSWHAVYHLHRVVLIQSGFFRSLFTAGFAESSPRSPAIQDELQVMFDDLNITRAAFELCIARLYGGGPQLHVSPALKATLTHPLTPGFPHHPEEHVPEGHQEATPQFLVSLLATSIYLSIPSVASHALTAIYGTIGPYTVLQYLDFAQGKAVTLNDSDPAHLQQSAVGLETVAEMLDSASDSEDDLVPPSISRYPRKGRRSPSPDVLSASPNGSFERIAASTDESSSVGNDSLSFHYGAVSDKIGEAASAWLARWGPDLLPYEEQASQSNVLTSQPSIARPRRRAKTIPAGVDVSDSGSRVFDSSRLTIPLIWRRGGLDAHWIKALIASDSFFVKNERDRYDFAKRVLELRRSQSGVEDAEETVFDELFAKGIYYCNMTPEEIISISNDICPRTRKPFVSISVLQAANWAHTILRHQIIARPSSPAASSSTLSSSPKASENLGLATVPVHDEEKPLYPVPTDETLRIGERGGPSSEGKGISMEQLFAHSHSSSSHSLDSDVSYPVTFNESSFFGLTPRPSKSPNATFSPFPPFRFSVEFFDTDHLKEKDRLHSHTIWYAGSLFNVYIQVVKKKGSSISGQTSAPGQQLGIYVSRQSTVDNLPNVSSMNPVVARHTMEVQTGLETKENANVRNGVLATPTIHHHASIPSLPAAASTGRIPGTPVMPQPGTRSTTPVEARPGTSSSLPSSNAFSTPSYRDAFGFPYSLPYRAPSIPPVQPYRDSRPNVMAYFMVYCASPTGTSQTRFASGPDQFKVTGSWGWKSSSLREHDIPAGEGDAEAQASKVSLRATVILGVV